MTALLEARGLKKHFSAGRGGAPVRAVDGIDLTIAAGETLALVGESGSGKSTTGRLLLRLIEPSAGSVRLDGQDILALKPAALRRVRRELQIVFQDPYGSLNPRMTVGSMLAEPLRLHGLARGSEVAVRVAADQGDTRIERVVTTPPLPPADLQPIHQRLYSFRRPGLS